MNTNVALVTQWFRWAEEHHRHQTVHSYMRTYEGLLDALGEKPLASVTLPDLEGWLAVRLDGLAAATKQRITCEVRSLFGWLHERGLIPANPARQLASYTVDNERPRPISDVDWRRLWGADLSDTERAAFGLSMFVGLRRQEVCWLTRGQFSMLPTPRLVGVERKGGRRQDLPWLSLVQLHAEKLPSLLPDVDQFLRSVQSVIKMGGPNTCLLGAWSRGQTVTPLRYSAHMARWTDNLGIDVTPHQLRHGFVSNLLRAGVEVTVVSRLAGHRDLTTTMRYVSHADDPIAAYLSTPSVMDAPNPLFGELPKVSRYGV